jgi:hypothetical protein
VRLVGTVKVSPNEDALFVLRESGDMKGRGVTARLAARHARGHEKRKVAAGAGGAPAAAPVLMSQKSHQALAHEKEAKKDPSNASGIRVCPLICDFSVFDESSNAKSGTLRAPGADVVKCLR